MSTLRLLGSRIVITPLRRQRVGEIWLDMSRNDDNQQFRVLQVGPKVQDIKAGDHVLMPQTFEPLYEWTDKTVMTDAKLVEAVFADP